MILPRIYSVTTVPTSNADKTIKTLTTKKWNLETVKLGKWYLILYHLWYVAILSEKSN